MVNIRTEDIPDASKPLSDLDIRIRSKVTDAFSTFLRCPLVKEAFRQILDQRPTEENARFLDVTYLLRAEIFDKSVSEDSLIAYDASLETVDLLTLELDVTIVQDLEKHEPDCIPSTVFLRGICSLLQSFTYSFLRPFNDAPKARYFCHHSFTYPEDPRKQVFCWVQTVIFGGVLCFISRYTDGLHNVYIRLPINNAALVHGRQVDNFVSVLKNKETSLSRFDVKRNPRFMQDQRGAERIYGPLPWYYVKRLQQYPPATGQKKKMKKKGVASRAEDGQKVEKPPLRR